MKSVRPAYATPAGGKGESEEGLTALLLQQCIRGKRGRKWNWRRGLLGGGARVRYSYDVREFLRHNRRQRDAHRKRGRKEEAR